MTATNTPDLPFALKAEGIVQTYPGVRALKGVDLALRPGSITALVGENGAGKSTLIRILAGIEQPTAGSIQLNGEPVVFASPERSQQAGISVVSQEFRLVPQLSVAENIFLGHELRRAGFIDRDRSRQNAKQLLGDLGLSLDPTRRVETLNVGDQQLVEITRALARDFDVLIMDEPTASLNGDEVSRLLKLVQTLKTAGKAILYVSHHLEEVFAIADEIVVFRDGDKIAQLDASRTTEDEIVTHMLGRELVKSETRKARDTQDEDRPVRLELAEFRCARVTEPVNVALHQGEILGIAGLVGSGRTELMQSLFGVLRHRGQVRLNGKAVRFGSPAAAISAGIFMLTESRKQDGIFAHLDVLENLLIGRTSRPKNGIGRFVPVRRQELAMYRTKKDDLRVRVSTPAELIGNLSGGNQQKVLFGRATLSGCSVLLLNEPTRGVDVGAKVEIYQLIRQLADEGVSIVVSSSDAPELVALADRCLVLNGGRVNALLAGKDVTEPRIVAASIGAIEGVAA